MSYDTITKKTSLNLISEVLADITSGITSNITSAAGSKPKYLFLFLYFYLKIVASLFLIYTLFINLPFFYLKKGRFAEQREY